MCANYLPPKPQSLRRDFGVAAPAQTFKPESYPGYLAPIIRLADDGSQEKECVAACFGMVPPWADLKLARQTYNARTETVAEKPSFRNAWRKRQFCIVPAEAIFEPLYEDGPGGHATRWKIAAAGEGALGIAGIWDWRPHGGPDDQPLLSFSMLTINADQHPLMKRFHRPGDEKRMTVILEPRDYDAWLHASTEDAPGFLQPCPAERLQASAAPRPAMRKAKPAAHAHIDDLFSG